jgi:hypothetical protein
VDHGGGGGGGGSGGGMGNSGESQLMLWQCSDAAIILLAW